MAVFDRSDVFFIVLAITQEGVAEKSSELKNFGAPFVVICGEKITKLTLNLI
jgi:hypothetical protein